MIGVFCPLSYPEPSYSVGVCAIQQVELLRAKGLDAALITRNSFPRDVAYPVVGFNSTKCSIRRALRGIDTLLVHDAFFVDGFKLEGRLLGEVLSESNIKTIVWSHSVPTGTRTPLPFSARYVSLTRANIPRVAKFYDVPQNDVFYVPNFIDPKVFFDWSDTTNAIVAKSNALSRYPIITYFTRTHPGKNPLPILKLVKALQELGEKPLFIWGNSFPSAEEAPALLDELKAFSAQNNLGRSLLITSEQHDIGLADGGLPKETVRELSLLGDISVFPSTSEAGSLSLLEASLTDNLILLNRDVPSFLEYGGSEIETGASNSVLYESFGGLERAIRGFEPSEDEWYLDLARRVAGELALNRSKAAKRQAFHELSPDNVFKEFLEPLLR